MSIFTESTNDANMSSLDDIGFDASEMDTSASDYSSDEETPKDYWFGRKYFECVIAQSIVQDSRLYESVAQVDSRLERAIQHYPYSQGLTDLRANGLERLLPVFESNLEHNAYCVMMFCIGAVVRKGDRRQRAVMLAILRRQEATVEKPGASSPQSSTTHDGPRRRSYSHRVEQYFDGVDSAAQLGHYAIALKEYCDKRSLVLTHDDVEELSKVPPRFRAVTRLEGSVYTGTAQTKKQARHKAAQKACADMGIQA